MHCLELRICHIENVHLMHYMRQNKAWFPLPELTAWVDGWPVSITRQHGPCWRARGFHYPCWRPELTGDRFPLPVNTGRVDGRVVSTTCVDGLSWRVTGFHYPSTRAVLTGAWFPLPVPVLTGETLLSEETLVAASKALSVLKYMDAASQHHRKTEEKMDRQHTLWFVDPGERAK